MTYQINKKQSAISNQQLASQRGVTLLLAILVLSSLLAISFSIATILFIEIRTSGDLLRTEPALYAANGIAEEALFNVKRNTCPNGNCIYPTAFTNNVTLPTSPSQVATNYPLFQDKVPANTSFNTANTYLLYNAAQGTGSAAGSNYGRITIKYIDTGNYYNPLLHIYVCEYSPNSPVDATGQTINSYNSTPCSDTSDTLNAPGNISYWIAKDVTLSKNSPNFSLDLNPNKQQELFLFNPATAGASIFASIETFGPGSTYAPVGLPYNGQTAVDIGTINATVGRHIRVIVPTGSTGGFSANVNGFFHNRQISINSNQVSGGGPLASFPVLVNYTDPTLKSASNGGNVQSNTGYDIVFTSDAGGTNVIPYEQEKYDPTTGNIVYWVNITSLTNASTFYMFYDKAGATDQSNKIGVWDINYQLVWHLPNGSVLSGADSTQNNSNGSINGATAAAGKSGGGASFSSNKYIGLNINVSEASYTASGWFKTSTANTGLWQVDCNDRGSCGYDRLLYTNSGNVCARIWNNENICTSGTNYSDGNWHYLVHEFGGSVGGQKIYVDGQQKASGGKANSDFPWQSGMTLGFAFDMGYFTGSFDEFHVSNIARSSDWTITEYNNQSSPSNFYTVGPEQ